MTEEWIQYKRRIPNKRFLRDTPTLDEKKSNRDIKICTTNTQVETFSLIVFGTVTRANHTRGKRIRHSIIRGYTTKGMTYLNAIQVYGITLARKYACNLIELHTFLMDYD